MIKKCFVPVLLLLFICCTDNNLKTYELDNNWPGLPNDFILGNPTGIGVSSSNDIVLFHRGSRVWKTPMPTEKIKEKTILILDNITGKIKDAWGSNLFIMPHGLEVDNEDNIWVTDVALHQVFKFDYSGKLLMVIGIPNEPGNDSLHFNLPTDVAVRSDGTFYVSDGYGNSRVIKFSKKGNYLFEWGSFGNEEGTFNIPHGLDLDKSGNVYVADRENNRIQKFDSLGKFINLWQNKSLGQLYSVNIDNNENHLFGIDYVIDENFVPLGSDIFCFDLDLNMNTRFGRTGFYEGKIKRYHDIQVDEDGNIFAADILGNSIQKFILVKK
tara:strand:- start:4306 stop:5283 length:978 start_codon:yes stop_codon:yes gene_type:complete